MDAPQISSKEAGTSQQHIISNNITTMTVQAEKTFVGCNIYIETRTEAPIPDNDNLECTLKDYLTTLCQAPPLPWYPEYTWDIDEFYTELALQKSAKTRFGVDELFKHAHVHFSKGGSYRILIEGDAGYGKSTLILKIASDWSKRDSNDHPKYTSPFSLLFVVKLGYVGEDEKLLSYMESVYDEKMVTPLKDLLKSKAADEVLILLDGYDEANTSTKKEVGRIMVKDTMSKCHVVLTSRSGHAPYEIRGKALLVTVKGFGLRQVTEAVGKFFIKTGHVTKDDVISCTSEQSTTNKETDRFEHPSFESVHQAMNKRQAKRIKQDDLILPTINDFKSIQPSYPPLPEKERLSREKFKRFLRQVQAESPYKELAQCPLLCVMLCCLVSECPNGELPSTCAGLYFAMINRNLCRAAVKKASATGKDEYEWGWSVLVNRIPKGHESYLQEFGRLCIDGLKTKRMSFTLFEVVGKDEVAKATDVKVTQLTEAGVLVKDFTELEPSPTSRISHHQPRINKKTSRYQVPHRTTAEFLAAYYLSAQTDQDILQQNLLDLFRLRASFNEVADFLIEMGKERCLADAFRIVKFPSNWLESISFMGRYCAQHSLADTWSQFEPALPNTLQMTPQGETVDDVAYVTVTSSWPCVLLKLAKRLGVERTGQNDESQPSQENPPAPLPDCPVSVIVHKVGRIGILQFPQVMKTLLDTGVVLDSLEYLQYMNSLQRNYHDDIQLETTCGLRKLLKADTCPVHLDLFYLPDMLVPAVAEAMQEVPEACRLKTFAFLGNQNDTSELAKVLADKWLSKLEHLGLESEKWAWSNTLNPLLKRLSVPGSSLTSLHLCNNSYKVNHRKEGPLLEDLLMFASKLETIKLQDMELDFYVTNMIKYAEKHDYRLKRLHLVNVSITLNGALPLADENTQSLFPYGSITLNLEELTINNCTFEIELLSWLNLSIPNNLRTAAIGAIYRITPNNGKEFYANQLLEALTRSSGDSIEDLSLLENFWGSSRVLLLHPIREALQRCPRMKSVNLGISREPDTSRDSMGPGPSSPISSDEMKSLENRNLYLALFEVVLKVPRLQSLASKIFFVYYKQIETFHAVAKLADRWPGKGSEAGCNRSLTLRDLSHENAWDAMEVFRERKLKYGVRYVTDQVYEFWFPKCNSTQ